VSFGYKMLLLTPDVTIVTSSRTVFFDLVVDWRSGRGPLAGPSQSAGLASDLTSQLVMGAARFVRRPLNRTGCSVR
jgi:hypothetical protein